MNNKGFITIYGILLLNLVLPFSSMLIECLKTTYLYHQDNVVDYAEIHTINKVKKDLLAYEESDETFSYLDYDIDLRYEDITCYIKIYKQEKLIINAVLVFDDIEEEIESYTYIQ